MMYLYNSLTRTKEEFVPLQSGRVSLYTCGPTVYDYQHIGNMRAYITWDILKRVLIASGYEVTHIMNITDVGHLTSDADVGEDKMEVAKQRERMTAWEVSQKYFDYFKQNLERLNILEPTHFVKATDLIQEQIAFVQKLEEKGYLYRTSDGMYFDTSKFPEYGKLGTLDMGGLKAGARVEMSAEKKNPTDFAVWKFSPENSTRDMEWDSPWGTGFPGWHLECSVISMKYLGETFDIHTGGIDHRTVHHPNEMAQSQAVTGKLQARYWLHNNFMTHSDKKMSKSAGTFVRLDDLEMGGVKPLAYRYFVLQTHYRKEIAYSAEAIKAAQTGLLNMYKDVSFLPEPGSTLSETFMHKFMEAVHDDLNTAKALDVVQRLLKSSEADDVKTNTIFAMDAVLGLSIKQEWQRRRKIPEAAQRILEQRAQARQNKDWATSDILRDRLAENGVEVLDTKTGQAAVLAE